MEGNFSSNAGFLWPFFVVVEVVDVDSVVVVVVVVVVAMVVVVRLVNVEWDNEEKTDSVVSFCNGVAPAFGI